MGGRIPNLGEVGLDFLTKEQHRCRIVFQVANVKRPLLAVSTLTRAGNHVSFGPHGGEIRNTRTGRKISFVRRDGIYVLEVLVAPPAVARGQPALAMSSASCSTGHASLGEPGWKVVQNGCKGPGFARPGATQ